MDNRIRIMREKMNITQTELASRLNVNKSYLCAIENGKKPVSVKRAQEIADKLGCTLNDIFLP